MRRKLLIAVPLLFLVTLAAWMLRPRRETLGEAFVSEKVASLLSGIAQVREPVGMLHYGERVDVVGRRNDYVKVRTNAGMVGWVESQPCQHWCAPSHNHCACPPRPLARRNAACPLAREPARCRSREKLLFR